MDNAFRIGYPHSMNEARIRLEGIDPRTWEHPADRAALALLTQIPGLADLLKTLGSVTSDRALRLTWLSTAVRSGPLQIPAAHQAVAEACRVLDVSPAPEVFVAPGPDFNARVIGFDAPFVVLGAGLVEALSPDELLSVAGHEIAHLKAGHTVYRTALWLLTQLSLHLAQVAELVRLPVYAALRDWDRKSELSCDRAGLLACQNPQAALGALLKVSYPGLADRIDPAELLRQGTEWEATGDLLDSLFKLLGSWDDSHPALVQRYAALHQWAASDDYPAILAGTLRKSGPGDPVDEARAAWDGWKADLNRSADPGTKIVADAVRQAEALLKDLLGR
jgi:Zn-dependent protease with chaperone function